MAALAVAALSGGGAASPGTGLPPTPHLPFYNHHTAATMLTHNWYHLANVARTFQNAAAAAAVHQDVDKNGGVGGEQPLDLSKGSSHSSNGSDQKVPLGNNVRLPTLDTKHIFK